MSIVATYCVFNEAELIAESIRSVKALVDRFVIVDSAYTSNPTEATHSTDATREIAERAADPVPLTYVESDRKLELAHARNMSLGLCDPDDWALTIDGDETLLGAWNELHEMFGEVRTRRVKDPIGMGVFTAALKFNGHAPDIDSDAYRNLPVIHTRGVQARLFPVNGVVWQRTPTGRRTYGMYRDGQLIKTHVADPRAIMVNHRTRQTFGAYQSDYVWEMVETGAK